MGAERSGRPRRTYAERIAGLQVHPTIGVFACMGSVLPLAFSRVALVSVFRGIRTPNLVIHSPIGRPARPASLAVTAEPTNQMPTGPCDA